MVSVPAGIDELLPASFTVPNLTEEDFLDLCAKFPDAFLEYTPEGSIVIMPPTDPETSARVAEITYQLSVWSRQHGGIVIGPDGGFRLPGGSRRSPHVSWFDAERWRQAKSKAKRGTRFPKFAPEFVIELRSPGDRVGVLRDKMLEYLDNGVQLGWLIEPEQRRVTIYRPGQEPEVLIGPSVVRGEGPVAGFELPLDRVFV